MLLVLGIFVGILIYLLIARCFFHSFAKKDFFKEFRCISYFEFPTKTFFASLFWIVTLPILLVALLVNIITEEISTSYCAIFKTEKDNEINRMKSKEMEK